MNAITEGFSKQTTTPQADPKPAVADYESRPKSAYEERAERFDHDVLKVYRAGGGVNLEPIIKNLNRTYNLASGLEQVLRICNQNVVVEDWHGGGDEKAPVPFSHLAIGNLMVLAEEIAGVISSDIDELSDWMGRDARRRAGK